MQKDLFGKTRYRVNLHTHTTVSDGKMSPEKVIRCYGEKGYDAIALTDHWTFGKQKRENGVLILSGAEYDQRPANTTEGLFHVVGVGMEREPDLSHDADTQTIIHAIREAGGLPILAHPAWSLNSPAQILALEGLEATEIYNSVSGLHMSRRPDSGLIVDMLGAQGRFYPLLASDDAHYYDGDECMSWIMVEAPELTREALLTAIRNGNFYATQGPEVHLLREGNTVRVVCSPCCEIAFWSDLVWSERVFTGEDLTEAEYRLHSGERFVRAEVTDRNGHRAWTNCMILNGETI